MSGFRDSFTKEDAKEDLLGYDDTASLYFAITILTCVAVPWTLSALKILLFPGEAVLRRQFPRRDAGGRLIRYCATAAMSRKVDEARQRAQRWTKAGVLCSSCRAAVLCAMWILISSTVVYLRTSGQKEIIRFDPFAILEVPVDAPPADLKRSYRRLSLVYHPDKNPDDPLAASRFIQITKAYAALTDETAKRNWEKYGNPDGPQTSKVGIGLPQFLLQKENSLCILCSFFFAIVVVVPSIFICYYSRAKNYAANGVMTDTLQFLGFSMKVSTRSAAGPELLAACAESRSLPLRTTDNQHIQALAGHVIEHKPRTFELPAVAKNQYLLWAHLQRQHGRMSPELRSDCDALLRDSLKVTQAMIEVACMREWFACAHAMVEFRRGLVQALDLGASPLLQVPHLSEEHAARWQHGPEPVCGLPDFLAAGAERRRALLGDLGAEQLLDVEAFCSHVSKADVRARVFVEDEPEIVVNDVATVSVRLERRHLRAEEAMGPVHAPFFPDAKHEEWWLFLVEEVDKARIVHFERVRGSGPVLEEELRFQVTRPGLNKLVLHVMSDSYSGLDTRVELCFEVLPEDACRREYRMHEDDLRLSEAPTLLQQWFGERGAGDESEDEEDED